MNENDELTIEEIDEVEDRGKRKPKKKKGLIIALLVVLGLLVAFTAAAIITFFHFYNKTNVERAEDITVDSSYIGNLMSGDELIDNDEMSRLQSEMEESYSRAMEDSKNGITSSEADSYEDDPTASGETDDDPESESKTGKEGTSSASDATTNVPHTKDPTQYWSLETTQTPTVEPWDGKTTSNVFNLMLVGVDREQPNWNGNSDTMILVSINYTRKTVTLTSFMRDSAANIPGVGFTKLNHAFAVGGGPLLVSTIRANYGIQLDCYAWVDFDAMRSIANIIGGVDLVLTPAEAKYCGYGTIAETQLCHLNPAQTVMHCRDRKSGGNDYQRTQRQRNVLMAIANKAKAGGLGDLIAVANALLPYIHHNVNPATVAQVIANLPSIVGYTFNEQRIPYNGMYNGTANGNLVPLFSQTASRWHQFVYGY